MAVALCAAAILVSCGGDDASALRDAAPDAYIVLEGGPDGARDAAADAVDPADAGEPPIDPSSLPPWLDRTRVHGHTRLWRVLEGTPEFSFAAAGLEGLGARSFSRHVKTGEEDPWWPSAEPMSGGVPVLAGTADLTVPMVDSATAAGIRMVGYYWHAADARVAELHPEWVCRDFDGAPAVGGRGIHLDVTSGYGDVVRTRLVELAERGFDGVYLDLDHLPPEGCFGTALEEAFVAATPSGVPVSRDDARFAPYVAFASARVGDAVGRWRDATRAVRADFAIVASASDLPGLVRPHARTDAIARADAPKTELHLALDPDANEGVLSDGTIAAPPDDVRIAFGFALLRDASEGLPHVWAPGLPNAAHARGFVAAVTAWGGVATLNVAEELVLHDDGAPAHQTTRPALSEAFAFGREVSDAMAGARPLRFAAVHFPEAARDARASPAGAWREVIAPATAAFEALIRARVPAGLVTDAQLASGALDGYALLLLPAPADVSEAQRSSIEAFAAAGGTVIEMDAAWAFGDPAASASAHAALRATLDPSLASAPIRVEGGPPSLHAVVFTRPDGTRLIALVNGIDWVQTHEPTHALDPADVRPPPPPATDVRVLVTGTPPSTAREALTGAPLAVEPGVDASSIALPAFAFMALVELD